MKLGKLLVQNVCTKFAEKRKALKHTGSAEKLKRWIKQAHTEDRLGATGFRGSMMMVPSGRV